MFIFLWSVFAGKGQFKLVFQPSVEYKLHTNKTQQFSFYANGLNWQVLPNNFLGSNKLNYGAKVGYVSKYFGAYLGLNSDNSRLGYQLKIMENDLLAAVYNFDKTSSYYRISNQYDFFILGKDTFEKRRNLYSQLLFSIGGDLSITNYKGAEFDRQDIQSAKYVFSFENTYGGPLAKQLFMTIGLTYKIITRKKINAINFGLAYRFTKRNFAGTASGLRVYQIDSNNTVKTYYFPWSASQSGIYFTISTDLVFKKTNYSK